jgi:DegV family protein with EDD domain
MSIIRIVTDSDASLPPALADQYGIGVVPINIHFDEETLRTDIDIDDAGLFRRIDEEGATPTTSAPSPGQFADACERAFSDGADEVLCICVSGEVSATYNAALQARTLLPDQSITVMDSRNISMGLGFMALEAAKAAEAGAGVEAALAAAEQIRARTSLYAALATLKYLAMSGRVGHLVAGMADVLRIKPVLTMVDGKLDMLEKVRTRKKALARVIQLTQESLSGRSAEQMAVLHVDAEADAEEFIESLRETLPCPKDIIMANFTPGLSLHTGKGLLGVVAVAAESTAS